LPPLRDVRPESPVNDHRIIELERAATIAEAVRPTPAPAPTSSKPKPVEPAAGDKAPAPSEAKPFFGGLPDDPGVRDPRVEPEPKTRLRLF
jgi:HemY protein